MFGFHTVKEIQDIVKGVQFQDKRQVGRWEHFTDDKGKQQKRKVYVPETFKAQVRVVEVTQMGKWTEITLNNGLKVKIQNF